MDDELRRMAHAAREAVEREVDTDAEWHAAANRSITVDDGDERGTPRWLWIAAAAAALVLVVAGAVVFSGGGGDGELTVTPGTEPEGSDPELPVPSSSEAVVTTTTSSTTSTTAPPSTTAAQTTTSTSTSTTVPDDGSGEGPSPVAWQDYPWERSPIVRACVGEFECTRLVVDASGAVVSVDPSTGTLARHPGIAATLPADYVDPWLVATGPDDVVYLNVQSPGFDDPVGDLVAVSLADGDAGREIRRWPEALDRSGDTDLVAVPEGLVAVGCCGFEPVRPAPDAAVEFPWIDRAGNEVAHPIPTVRLHTQPLEIERDGRRWSIDYPFDDLMLRGMPGIVPTFDGGFLAELVRLDGSMLVVRGWPDGSTEQAVIDVFPSALEPGGTLLLDDGSDRFARVELFPSRPSGWHDRLTVNLDTWEVSAAGLDEFLDANDVTWEHDPVAFAHAVVGPLTPPESRQIRVLDGRAGGAGSVVVEVTTIGYPDDSVAAGRHVLVLASSDADDGALRLVSGTFSQTCQPGRGQQDFQPALCI